MPLVIRLPYSIAIGLIVILLLCPAISGENAQGENFTNSSLTSWVIPQKMSGCPPGLVLDPPPDHIIGNVFFINGTTNWQPYQKKLTLRVAFSRYPCGSDNKSLAIPVFTPNITLFPESSGLTRWSLNVTDNVNELDAGVYSVYVQSFWPDDCMGLPVASGCNFTVLPPKNGSKQKVSRIPVKTDFPDQSVNIVPASLPITRVTPLDLTPVVAALGAMVILRQIPGKKRD